MPANRMASVFSFAVGSLAATSAMTKTTRHSRRDGYGHSDGLNLSGPGYLAYRTTRNHRLMSMAPASCCKRLARKKLVRSSTFSWNSSRYR